MSEQETPVQEERGGVSRPVIIAALLFALAAAGIIAFLLMNRGDDPETPVAGAPEALDLAAPLFGDGSTNSLLHLVIDPVREGENNVSVHFTQGGEQQQPLDLAVDGVDLYLVPLDDADAARQVALASADDGSFAAEDPIELRDGWWEMTVTVYPTGDEPRSTAFYVLTPDPNLNGFDYEQEPGSDEARAFFEAGLNRKLTTHSIKYIERVTQGNGAAAIIQREVTEGINGNPPASRLVNAQFELITIGDQSFQRNAGHDWFERELLQLPPLSQWAWLYTDASNFQLGESVLINDRPTQIIMFYVPQSETSFPAWYVWWIDVETSYVIREAMLSSWHYMIYEFGNFDQPILLENPMAAATPVASPVASPVGSPVASPVAAD